MRRISSLYSKGDGSQPHWIHLKIKKIEIRQIEGAGSSQEVKDVEVRQAEPPW